MTGHNRVERIHLKIWIDVLNILRRVKHTDTLYLSVDIANMKKKNSKKINRKTSRNLHSKKPLKLL